MSGMQDVHRYRAEQLARTHYTKLQAPVAHFVRRRLGRAAENLPDQELEASYNVAWDALMGQVAQVRTCGGSQGRHCGTTEGRVLPRGNWRRIDARRCACAVPDCRVEHGASRFRAASDNTISAMKGE